MNIKSMLLSANILEPSNHCLCHQLCLQGTTTASKASCELPNCENGKEGGHFTSGGSVHQLRGLHKIKTFLETYHLTAVVGCSFKYLLENCI